jgi:hypothetical protein
VCPSPCGAELLCRRFDLIVSAKEAIWKSFDGYFYNDWQPKEILKKLAYADVA